MGVFVIIGIGLVVFCVLFFCMTVHFSGKSREYKKKVSELESSLSSMAIGLTEIEKLKEQIRNQQSDIELLKEKGDKKDAITLRRYERCAQLMALHIPGFYQTWEKCMDEVLQQEEEENRGLKRIFRPFVNLLNGKNTRSIPATTEKNIAADLAALPEPASKKD